MCGGRVSAYRRGMVKQVVSSFLWFFTVAWGWNYVALLTGLPSIIGLGLGVAAGAFVWVDPFHLIRPAPADAHGVPASRAVSHTVQRAA